MPETLHHLFAEAAQQFGPRVALIEGSGRRVTFEALQARITALAAGWSGRGLRPGDRVLIAMPVGADLYAALAAIWSLGAIAVLPEPAMGLAGLRHAAKIGAIKGFVAAGGYEWLRFVVPELWGLRLFHPRHARAGAVPSSAAQDLALISFTSGSTGAPKAIPRSHGFLMAQFRAVAPLLDSDADEVDLVAFPVFVLINLALGRCSVLPNWRMRQLDQVRPDALQRWIYTQGVTRALLPPALCEVLAETHVSLRTLFTGGGPVFPDLVARLQARAPQMRIVSVYGSTEAEPIAHLEARDVTPDDVLAMRAGKGLLAGHPVAQIKLRIMGGEIVVSGAHVNRGYLDPARDAETKLVEGSEIWHRTGDAGYLDGQGRLWLLGRYGAEVRTASGVQHPFAIETAARLWPGVQRAALVDMDGQPVLCLEGDGVQLAAWQRAAVAFGIERVQLLDAVPMDQRHRSKVDYPALRRMLR